jgi:hypothetical protein
VLALGLALLVWPRQVGAAPAEYGEPGWRWRHLTVSGAEGPLVAVAVDASSDRVAVADPRGALLASWPGSADDPVGWRRAARVAGVSDLHFDGLGALWIASLTGLWRLDAGGRLEDRSPGPGDAARRILRVSSSGGLHVAAGAGGAFVSSDGLAWRRLRDGLPSGAIQAVAVGESTTSGGGPGWELWLLAERELWHLAIAADGMQFGQARRVRIPGRPLDALPADLALDLAGSEVVVVYPRALARTLPGRVGAPRWEIDYPVWPAGAAAVRIIAGSGSTLWLATDRGLLHAQAFAGPWVRAGSPLGSMSVAGIVHSGGAGSGLSSGGFEQTGAVLAVGSGGLYRGRPEFAAQDSRPARSGASAGLGATRDAALLRTHPPEPGLARIQAQALRHVGLAPEYFRGLRAGLGGRGWWPVLVLRAGAGFDRDREDGLDQSFTYGELHDLRDHSEDRSEGFDASISLAWDLGDIAYPPDATELSREARQVIGLRDNVLDELTQLYFDRRRALLALDAQPDKRSTEAVALRLRAEELAAGLDAWTGGWFSRGLVGEANGEAP